MARLGVTRSVEGLAEIAPLVSRKGFELVPLPLTETVPVAFDLAGLLAGKAIDWLVFSSANGVRHFFNQLSQSERQSLASCRTGVVGAKTATALRKYDFVPTVVASQNYGVTLFDELAAHWIHEGETVVYPRAETITTDPSPWIAGARAALVTVVCYRTVERDLSDSPPAEFGPADIILFTAPSAARAYYRRYGKPICTAMAIGKTTAEAMTELGFDISHVMTDADIAKVVEYL